MFECANTAQRSEQRSSAADAPLIELAVITGAAAGFPGIHSSSKHTHSLQVALTHTYTQIFSLTPTHKYKPQSLSLVNKRAHTHEDTSKINPPFRFQTIKNACPVTWAVDGKYKMHVHKVRQAY